MIAFQLYLLLLFQQSPEVLPHTLPYSPSIGRELFPNKYYLQAWLPHEKMQQFVQDFRSVGHPGILISIAQACFEAALYMFLFILTPVLEAVSRKFRSSLYVYFFFSYFRQSLDNKILSLGIIHAALFLGVIVSSSILRLKIFSMISLRSLAIFAYGMSTLSFFLMFVSAVR